jgi:hypothetical protein
MSCLFGIVSRAADYSSAKLSVVLDLDRHTFYIINLRCNTVSLHGKSQNVTVEWLIFQIRIQEVLVSDLCPDTGNPNWFFMAVLSYSSQMPGWGLRLGHDRFLPRPF